jgi:serine/threonine protein kinase
MFYDRRAPRQGFGVIVAIPGTDLLSESPKINLPPPPGTRPEREKTCWQCGESFVTALDVCPNDGARLVDIALDDNHDPLIGTTIDARYRVKDRLGEGGMGMVYQAWDPQRREDVAIKVLKADYLRDENIRRRFMHEARIIANLEHPNAVRMHNFGQMPDGNFYMVMELLKGESLAERLAYKFLTYGEIFNLIPPICDVLAEAHEKGVVHRDLKPENIFIVTDDEGQEQAKLIDFGVSKNLARQTLTQTGTLWGTPAYMSPEQARGDAVGAGADIYAMAIILFELICGHLPFTAETQMGYAVKHMHSEPRSMLSIPGMYSPPEELDALILQGLAKQPEDRPASMEVFANHLRQIIAAYFDEAASLGIPAQEIDPEGLQAWVAQDAISGPYDATSPGAKPLEPTNEISPFRTKNNGYDTVAVGEVSEPEVDLSVEKPALGRTIAVGVGVLLLFSVVVGIAINASQPSSAKADERVSSAGQEVSDDTRDSPDDRASSPPSENVVNSLAGSDAGGEAAGQGASRAAAMVIHARSLTQLLSGAPEVEARTTSKGKSRRSGQKLRSRNSGKRKSSSSAAKKEEEKSDKLEDALKGTF